MGVAKLVVHKFARHHTQTGYRDIDDLHSIAYMACCEAVDNWDPHKVNGATLSTFATLVIQRRLIDTCYGGKKMSQIICLSLTPIPALTADLDKIEHLDACLETSLFHTLVDAFAVDYEALDKALDSAYVKTLIHYLTPGQQRVYVDLLDGMTYAEMSAKHHVTIKSLQMHRDNLMIRLRQIAEADNAGLPRPVFHPGRAIKTPKF